MSHSLLSQRDWQLNEPVGRNQPWSVGRISLLCQQSRSFLSLPETVGAQACRPCPGSHLQSSCWGCVAASPSGSAAGQRLDEPRQTEESEKGRQRQRGEMETEDGRCYTSLTFFSHLHIFLAGDVFPPGFLDGPGVAVKLALPRLFQQKQLWRQTETQHNTVKDRHTCHKLWSM